MRTQWCKACPRQKHLKAFREETTERWEKILGKEALKLNFDAMVNTFYTVASFDKLTDEVISVKNARLLAIYRSEKAKADRRNAAAAPG